MLFWILVIASTLVVLIMLLRPLLSRADPGSKSDQHVSIYRDQLEELDGDIAKGVISGAEAEATRIELSRQILKAAEQAERDRPTSASPPAASYIAIAALALCLAGGGLGLYLNLGVPGLEDRPLAQRGPEIQAAAEAQAQFSRPSQALAEELAAPTLPPSQLNAEEQAQYNSFVLQVEAALEANPEDIRAREVLTDLYVALGRPQDARRMQDEILNLIGEDITADNFARRAEVMILATGGYVSPEAEAMLGQALTRDPRMPLARYYAGHALLQSGAVSNARQVWTDLLEDSPEDAPWRAALEAEITNIDRMMEQPGPSAEQIDQATSLSAEEQRDMAAAMVERLAERLASEGGAPQDWARLIQTRVVLGQMEQAQDALAQARTLYRNDPVSLAMFNQIAQDSGLALE